jgi:cell division protease FtsH
VNNMAKNLLLWLLIAAVLLSVFNNFNLRSATEQVGYSEFIREVQTDRLSKVLVDGLTITAQRKDGSSFETIRPMVEDPKLMDDLLAHNVTVEGKQPEQQSVWTQLLIASFPILLIIAVFMFFMRQMQGGGGGRGGPMSFGKSKAKLLGEDQITTTFADVAGVEEAKLDLMKPIQIPCIRRPKRKPSPKSRTVNSDAPDVSRKNKTNNIIGAYSMRLPCARMARFSSSSSPLPCAIKAKAGLPRRPMTRIDNTNSQIANNEQ